MIMEAAMYDLVQMLDSNLIYLDHQVFCDSIIIYVCSKHDEATCPYCGTASSRIHSSYERSFQDLPIQGKKVNVIIDNRKYFCDNPRCHQTTFAEAFGCLKPKSKKSNRLLGEIVKISIEVSSVTASRVLSDGFAKVCKSTVCDILKKNGKSIGQGKRRENMH
jgi:transposase